MRSLPPTLDAALQSGASTLCRCWLLTRRDGFQLGLTDHDRDIGIGPLLFEATGGIAASAHESSQDLATGGGEISGALTSARILPEDIENGLYDGAELRSYLVDWSNPALDFQLDYMNLGEIRRIDGRFIAETRDAFHALDQEQGRLYSSACSAELGDARCKVNLTATPFRVNGAVLATDGLLRLSAGIFASAAEGLFTRGTIGFTSGTNAGVRMPIKAHRADEITLWRQLARPILPGDAFWATAGCDKRFSTCRDRYANAPNFRGFPFIPTPEQVLAYARPGEGSHRGRPLVKGEGA
ncbi:MAG: DUF2163 domain-containing protein [Proteobacteria bacterium]|nr:DUF2163 domain-containing protein [Pseudomonadota bacterium]